jgi:transposase
LQDQHRLLETAVTQVEYWSGLNDQTVLCRVLWDEPATNSVTRVLRIGMDTSKLFFQLHGVDYAERPVLRRKLRRNQVLAIFAKLPPTVVGMGATHYWARELRKLGHGVKLMAPQHV